MKDYCQYQRELLSQPTAINFNYWYGIGFLLLLLSVNQVISGVTLASYQLITIDLAFSSCDYLIRELNYGFSFRYLHCTAAY